MRPWIGVIAFAAACASVPPQPAAPTGFHHRHPLEICSTECQAVAAARRPISAPRSACEPPEGDTIGSLRIVAKDPRRQTVFLVTVVTQCRSELTDEKGEAVFSNLAVGLSEVAVYYGDIRQRHPVVITPGPAMELRVTIDPYAPRSAQP